MFNKKKFKVDERPKCETEVTKILENTSRNLFDLDRNKFLLDLSLEARETKAKMNYWDFIKELLHSEGNNQQS